MNGAERIAQERDRQQALGWSTSHDQDHDGGELLQAAVAYIRTDENYWPFELDSWKPNDPIRNLEKAGAFVAAEIDRMTALAPPADKHENAPDFVPQESKPE